MIKITLEQLLNSSDSLKALSQKQLKARCAYAVGRLLKAADNEIASFNETRLELIKKYGEKDENGELKNDEQGNVHIPQEVISEFNAELQDLLKTEIEINANKIKIEDIGDVEFTPAEMSQLDEFIEFEE